MDTFNLCCKVCTTFLKLKDTVMQIEEALINDRLGVSKVS